MSIAVKIRVIAPQDYPQAIKVIKRSITESLGRIYPAKLTEAFCGKYKLATFKAKAKRIKYWVAVDNHSEQVIGIIRLKDNRLRTFFVDPNYQRRGVGRKLYEQLEKQARKARIQELVLEDSPLGKPTYLSFGFRKVGTLKKEWLGVPYTDAIIKKLYVPGQV